MGSQASGNDSNFNYQLHPCFGFINRAGSPELPFKRANKDQFIIGIFGGSVAQQYYFYELGHRVLIQALQRLTQFQTRRLR